MKVLLAPDKFKGSCSALEVAHALAKGLGEQFDVRIHPMADGGDGSLEILQDQLGLEKVTVATLNPLHRPIQASYYRKNQQIYVEVAAASGLALLTETERNPLLTSSRGTGRLIAHGLEAGAREVFLFLGGSATNDLGLGIAYELGFRPFDAAGRPLQPTGGQLEYIAGFSRTQSSLRPGCLHLLCDVDNPLLGPNGAARIYAGQKGGSAADIVVLERGLQSSSAILKEQCGRDPGQLVGGGAAGGIAAGLFAIFGATVAPGFATISRLTGLEQAILEADVVISGEGKLDLQSLSGKVIDGVASLCAQYQKPLYLCVGASKLPQENWPVAVREVLAILDLAPDLRTAMEQPQPYLEAMGRKIREMVE